MGFSKQYFPVKRSNNKVRQVGKTVRVSQQTGLALISGQLSLVKLEKPLTTLKLSFRAVSLELPYVPASFLKRRQKKPSSLALKPKLRLIYQAFMGETQQESLDRRVKVRDEQKCLPCAYP